MCRIIMTNSTDHAGFHMTVANCVIEYMTSYIRTYVAVSLWPH